MRLRSSESQRPQQSRASHPLTRRHRDAALCRSRGRLGLQRLPVGVELTGKGGRAIDAMSIMTVSRFPAKIIIAPPSLSVSLSFFRQG